MAINHAIPELWAARILDGFYKQNLWVNLTTDLSSEFASGGDVLHLPSVSSVPTVKDYTVNTDIADPEVMTDVDNTFTLDKQKYFNIKIDDIKKVQAKPDMMAFFTQQASREIAQQVDSDLYATYLAGVPAGQKTEVAPIDPLAKSGATSYSNQKAQAYVSAINTVVKKLQDLYWPLASTWMMVSTNTAFVLREYLYREGVGSETTQDGALLDAQLTRLFGVRAFVSTDVPNATADGTPLVNFGTTDSVFFARQITQVESYRLEKQFADGLKGLFTYGSKKLYPNRVHQLVAKT